MRFGSLFTGIGGFDLAFERAGMECTWQCEIDKDARGVLQRHFEGAKIYDDVRTITDAEPVDLICGGFPCQDLSIAGKRKGLAGERSGLWHEFHRVLSEYKPRWAVIENVPGLLSSDRGRDFAVILSGLADIGYCTAWRVLDSQYFGVAQRRRRVFIIASLGSGSCAEVLFEREGVCRNPPARRNEGEEVAGTLDGKSCSASRGSQANELDFLAVSNSGGVTLKLNEIANTLNGQTGSETTAMFNGVIAYENHPNDSRITETGEISQQLTSRMGTGGGNVPLVQTLSPQVANTLAGGSSKCHSDITSWQAYGNVIVVNRIRRLTPTECERLQGFPDGWTEGQSDSARYKQLGNAVTVNVAEWIGKRIMEVKQKALEGLGIK